MNRYLSIPILEGMDATLLLQALQKAVLVEETTVKDEGPQTAEEYVNVGGWGIQAGDYLEHAYAPAGNANVLTLDNMLAQRALGATWIRTPANWAFRSNVAGVPSKVFKDKLDSQLQNAITAGFTRIILDPLHHFLQLKGDMSANVNSDDKAVNNLTLEQQMQRFVDIWQNIALAYIDLPLTVSFDLANELTKVSELGVSVEQMNEIYLKAIKVIRATGGNNIKRTIMLEPHSGSLNSIVVPKDFGNIVVQQHIYDPFAFTHGDKATITAADLTAYEAALVYTKSWGKKNNVPIQIGEAGSSQYVKLSAKYGPRNPDDRAEYLAAILAIHKKLNIPITFWDFSENFALWDRTKNTWLPGIENALTGKTVVREHISPSIMDTSAARLRSNSPIYDVKIVDGVLSVPANTSPVSRQFLISVPGAKVTKWARMIPENITALKFEPAAFVSGGGTADLVAKTKKGVYPGSGWRDASGTAVEFDELQDGSYAGARVEQPGNSPAATTKLVLLTA